MKQRAWQRTSLNLYLSEVMMEPGIAAEAGSDG
jgi:hypothetical protein